MNEIDNVNFSIISRRLLPGSCKFSYGCCILIRSSFYYNLQVIGKAVVYPWYVPDWKVKLHTRAYSVY